jgi:hypothetical protein
MVLSTVSKVQQIEDEWRAEQLADFLARKKQKEAGKTNEQSFDKQSFEVRLASLEAEVQRLKEKIECVAERA